MTEPLAFSTRIWFAFVCFFRVLFDGEFAARAFAARAPELAPKPAPEPKPKPEKEKPRALPAAADVASALQLLALFQREGRLVDFLQQDVASFSDQDIGAAARVVHAGCRKALSAHAEVEPVMTEDEGSTVTLEAGYDAQAVKLVGNVAGTAPFKGVLRHRGWRAKRLELPASVEGHAPELLAPAEVEL